MSKKKPSLRRCAEEFDRATFDALVAEKESDVRTQLQTKDPSKHFTRLERLYGQEFAYTVYAAEKVMAKIIAKRHKLEGRPIPYESWPKEQARIDVSGMYRDRITKQHVIRPTNFHGQRWTHGFGGAS